MISIFYLILKSQADYTKAILEKNRKRIEAKNE